MPHRDELYMARAIEIAKNSRRFSSPNPCVGAVIVHQDKIIAEGYTSIYGGAHGEINALKKVKNPNILSESTLYVTLEPCAHEGKTPSCAKKIAEVKPKRVVIGMLDPFEKVNGEGLKILQFKIRYKFAYFLIC
ncbi:MAG: hypothetical protein C4K58_05700 [Flavobacteriaceae bacterium]|nr:MAG: hypothetical protein C4K58_05700 [Flavobacteriaceae bacterium]